MASNKRKQRSLNRLNLNIPEKANRVLNIILITLLLFVLRLWHLSVVQYDKRLEESQKPQRRSVIEPARRATIRDRFNIPLAINKVQYQASIQYSQLAQVPSIKWEIDSTGKKIKHYKRKEYIAKLARVLAEELELSQDRLEDLIHAKGPLYQQFPFVIKEDISEKEYYRLKMLEKDWHGILVQRLPRRTYPQQKVAADLIGYLGAINRQEYESIIHEIKTLEAYVQARDDGEDPPLPEKLQSPADARKRLKELRERAYKVNDCIGKSGIEGRYEEELRGFQGKKSYYSDARGNFLRELPGSHPPIPGKRILLTISSELQEYAESLLAQNENIREAQVSNAEALHQSMLSSKQPWIKGGAIVAIDPNNGEIIALASHPRIDPNDFITSANAEINKRKRSNILRWFESEDYVAEIWNHKRPMEKELFKEGVGFYEETLPLSWNNYLSIVLSAQSPLHKVFCQINTVEKAIELQLAFEHLLKICGQENPYRLCQALYPSDEWRKNMPHDIQHLIDENFEKNAQEISNDRKVLDRYLADIPLHYDKVLAVDLCRMMVCSDLFSQSLVKAAGKQDLSTYRNASAAIATLLPLVKSMVKDLYQEHHFKKWRTENEQSFLKTKRAEEQLLKKYPKPYIDYLDQEEQIAFEVFWKQERWNFLTIFIKGKGKSSYYDEDLQPYVCHLQTWHHELVNGAHNSLAWHEHYMTLKKATASFNKEQTMEYLTTLRSYHQLDRPLLGKYRYLRHAKHKQLEKHLAAAFYPSKGFGYGRSQGYRQAATIGSIFKIITAYEALIQRYQQLDKSIVSADELNPLEIIDTVQKREKETFVGFHKDGTPISQHYKGGRLPKSSTKSIGKLDIVKAIETSSNPYFAIIAGDVLHHPNDLADAARLFGLGAKTGVDLPAEITGSIPSDLATNKTGLYAFAIGQHSLVVTPLQTSLMLAAIANGGKLLKPKIVSMTAGKDSWSSTDESQEDEIVQSHHFPYQESLSLVGLDFPLFTAVLGNKHKSLVNKTPTLVKQEIPMPSIVRSILLEGMKRVVAKMQQTGLSGLSRMYKDHPEAISDFIDLKHEIVGKTSTAESMENIDLDPLTGTNLYTHVWFGSVSFDNSSAKGAESFIFRDQWGRPELVVVVYLKYGKFGKDAAPIAAQVIKRWRKIVSERKYQ